MRVLKNLWIEHSLDVSGEVWETAREEHDAVA
jgi:hypothetical protein